MRQYDSRPAAMEFTSLDAFSRATGLEAHSRIVDVNIFKHMVLPNSGEPHQVYLPESVDFRLLRGSSAVDAGVPLPNINDYFEGPAPDLGALENGARDRIYGPRSLPK